MSQREFQESNGMNRNMLVLPPRILIRRRTSDNVDHATRQMQLTIKLTASSHCYARGDIETKRFNRCLNRYELTHPTRSRSLKPMAYTKYAYALSTNAINAERTTQQPKSTSTAIETTQRTTRRGQNEEDCSRTRDSRNRNNHREDATNLTDLTKTAKES